MQRCSPRYSWPSAVASFLKQVNTIACACCRSIGSASSASATASATANAGATDSTTQNVSGSNPAEIPQVVSALSDSFAAAGAQTLLPTPSATATADTNASTQG